MYSDVFAIQGDIITSESKSMMIDQSDGFLVCEDGKVAGMFAQLPEKYAGIPVKNARGKLVIPGLVDLHLHAPQFAFRGLGMDLELLEWLDRQTFPEEAKYADMEYAARAYGQFVHALQHGATTRAAVFATLHVPATLLLMDMLDESGLATLVGKVNMDRNASENLQEESAEVSLAATRAWLAAVAEKSYRSTAPILTPRFIPSCSDGLMEGLAALQRGTGLAVQSHLSENPGEVAWVKELCPEAETYADAYLQAGLFGGAGCPTIMAHCVHSGPREQELMARQGVYVAHCPVSNACLSSGVAPVRAFLDGGIHVGLGTDIAGGYDISIFGVMAQAIKDSKLRWRLQDDSLPALRLPEVFYMATRGGGSFFAKVGAFEAGYAFDAVVLDDSDLPCPFELTLPQRLERVMYLGGDANVAAKYVNGRQVV